MKLPYSSLTEMLISRQGEEKTGITFILNEKEEHFVSYGELYRTSQSLLYELQQAGFAKGDEVIFQIEDNRWFIYSFWACILGGMLPVPVTTGTNDEHKSKLFKIWGILTNPKILASRTFFEKLNAFAETNALEKEMEAIRRRIFYIDETVLSPERQGQIQPSEMNDIAFIQFSSGSTGTPKGVIITHKNVLINTLSASRWAEFGPEDSSLSWMPLTHDMGLIGTHITDVVKCIPQYNIQTQTFVRHPSLWLQKASEHKVTLLYSPNFGYKHFLKFYRSEEDKGWDLSSVRLIFNGAEPISMDLCNEFLDKMARYGLKRNAMYPVYGLAEGTIGAAFPHPGDMPGALILNRECLKVGDIAEEVPAGDNKGVSFADLGCPIYECFIRICDENDLELGENQVGFIQISGGNVTSGYYNDPIATQKAITSDGWLNTGDLGLMRNGRLYVTGRAKDIIFMAGQNYYSHDIERVAECVEGVELGKICAIGAFNEQLKQDELILFVIFKQKLEKFPKLALELKQVISQKVGIDVSCTLPIKSIPKTTSGKVQRYLLRQAYVNGEYDVLRREVEELIQTERGNRSYSEPKTEMEQKLAALFCSVLEIPKVGTEEDFFVLGGDSLKATQLASRIQDEFHVELGNTDIFENPQIIQLAAFLETAQPDEAVSISSTEVLKEDALPLSFAQQRLWFLDQLNGDSRQYNLYTAFQINGELDITALEKSMNQIINRHKILQMSFAEKDGKPFGKINTSAEFVLDKVDLSSVWGEEKTISSIQKSILQPFDLAQAPLLRGSVFHLKDNSKILVLTVHHVIFDGWSFGVLFKELEEEYHAQLNGKQAAIPALGLQYFNFADWQQAYAEQPRFQQQMDYWKKQLSGQLPVMELPTDRPRPAVQRSFGARMQEILPAKLVQKLKELAQSEKSTLYMLLLTGFNALLFRYTGQEELLIGTPIANRNRKETERLIGFFTNNLVLRTRLSGEQSFLTLLESVRETALEAYSNQDVSFEKLVEELHVQRDMSRNPLFQVLFSLQNLPLLPADFAGVPITELDIDSGFSRFDLSLDIREKNGALEAVFEYNSDLFNRDTIARLAGHYHMLLEAIVYNPSVQLDTVEFLPHNETKLLLEDWNDTKTAFEECTAWTELFAQNAAKLPESPAVWAGGKQLTYQELNQRANRLAHYLSETGVCRETVVGVYMNRSVDMLTALIGIHKAGGAYLPLDPIFPPDRLAYMLENAQVGILLTEEALKDTLPPCQARVFCVEELSERLADYPTENPIGKSDSKNLAYLLYTSGSTGKPKGVQIEQFALNNFLQSMVQKVGFGSDDKLLAVTTLSFDIAGLEMFTPLISGGCVVIAGREDVLDGERLAYLVEEHEITVMQATPATWRLMIDCGWKGCNRLKALCGGEALPLELAKELRKRCHALWNMYGPTETTIWSTMDEVEQGASSITIGRPIANTQIYILDTKQHPTPVGVPGELYIGGDGLARGYLHLPELTDEKFVKNPFSSKQESRLYRTGDLARYRADGRIEFVGRIDHQVKIRGFRIELGEIESVLTAYPAVHQCVVSAKQTAYGESMLVAYLIGNPEVSKEALQPEKLRKYLKEKLPDYMVPAAFVLMDEFPQTPNGKIDRKALPVPENLRPQLETAYTAPGNSTEEKLTAIWREVLKLDRIGVQDNFFDLGGHSLLLVQLSSRIEKALNKKVQVMDLFKYPTIHTLAAYLNEDSPSAETIFRQTAVRGNTHSPSSDIAVIGMSGRFPGAENIDEFWDNLCDGKECISYFSEEESIAEGVSLEAIHKPGYVRAWGTLKEIDKFDAAFFGYNPREAEVLDPQQRIFLEETWKALENAGYDSQKYPGLIGIYASTGMNTYMRNLTDQNNSEGLANDYQIMISNDKDFLATRVAYKLDLQGPGMTVQTACSSSLVAVHMACRSLLDGECTMALAGGVSIRMPQKTGYLYQEGMILSPDGHCRAFDAQAKGTVGGNGVGVVVLKRLEDALSDGDHIEAVIKGSAVNNDGALKVGYTAPRIDGQAKAIAEAQKKAGIAAETICCIEAHGTGTPLGDPIEMEALNQVFAAQTNKKGFCAVGSAKTNVGHLDAASGITGFIKTILTLKHKQIPPSLNFTAPNPKINFEDSPFYVNTKLREWSRTSVPMRAGVSSFGIGGTNAHVVLEEAPVQEKSAVESGTYLLVFSAKTQAALENMTKNFLHYLETHRHVSMADIAYTSQVGRRAFEYRYFIVCNSHDDAIEALKSNNRQTDSATLNTKLQDISDLNTLPLETVGQLWLSGKEVNWNSLYPEDKPNRVALPVYPFEGRSYWAKRKGEKHPAIKADSAEKVLDGKQTDQSEWFYAPVWKQSLEDITLEAKEQRQTVLLIGQSNPVSMVLADALRRHGAEVIFSVAGESFEKLGNAYFRFDPASPADYVQILRELNLQADQHLTVVNMLGLASGDEIEDGIQQMDRGRKAFYSMLYLAQALSQSRELHVEIKLVTHGTQRILDGDTMVPANALALGPCKVIPREYPNIQCTFLDIVLPEDDRRKAFFEGLSEEILHLSEQKVVAYRALQRWVQDFEHIPLLPKTPSAVSLRKNGTYLIAGGLGGIGLALAEQFASEVPVNLVLVGSSPFPREEEWDAWTNAHDMEHPVSQKIQRLRNIQKLGSTLLLCQTDITDAEQVHLLHRQLIERFGKVDGMLHAAGRPGGGMIQMKTPAFAEKVLAPKLEGTIALYNAFQKDGMDFFVLCSSLNAITGGFGQADYSAANIFMDIFAQANDSRTGTRVISIDWDRWPGTGMAVNKGKLSSLTKQMEHPLLGREWLNSSDKAVYQHEISPEKDWILSEHLVMGTPTVAGTTYLEMARAAFEAKCGIGSVEMNEVIFLAPLSVKENEKRDVFTVLKEVGSKHRFQIISRPAGAQEDWQEHAQGTISFVHAVDEKRLDTHALTERCQKCVFDLPAGKAQLSQEFIRFGSRWQALQRFYINETEGCAEVELNSAHVSDLAQYKLHPALMDVATGSLRLVVGGNYLPFSYEKLCIRKALTQKLTAHLRFKGSLDDAVEVLTCDMDIFDDTGCLAVEIHNFSMKRIGESSAQNIRERTFTKQNTAEFASLAALGSRELEQEPEFLSEGITETEGKEVFHRLLESCRSAQIIVSTRDIQAAIRQASYTNLPAAITAVPEESSEKTVYPRPELETEYVPPKNETEKRLAGLWQNVLGMDKVGIYDEFFELGGDSLLLIQLHTALKENFETELAVVDLYKYNTIAAQAKFLNRDVEEEALPTFTEVNIRANKQLEAMKQRKQQMLSRKGAE